MFNSVESINENCFLNDLVNETARFGIYGTYVNYQGANDLQNNGFYFVCGYNRTDVLNKENNLEKLYMEQSNTKTFRADIHITKLTDQSPFNCHQDIMRYCLHSSTLRAIGKKVGFDKTFKNVSTSFVSFVEAYYLNSIDGNLSYMDRRKNEMALTNFFHSEGAREIFLNGETGDRFDLHIRPEKLDKTIPNMVSLEELSYKTMGTEQMVITYDMLANMKSLLAKRPEILFFQAKPVMAKLNVPDNQGFGSKEANVLSSVILVYDVRYRKQVELMYLKTKYPQCFAYDVEDIKNKSRVKGICSFGVNLLDLETVFEKAKESGIPICVDTKKVYFTYKENKSPDENIAGYTVVIPNDDTYIARMRNILVNEATFAKSKTILSKEDIRTYVLNY